MFISGRFLILGMQRIRSIFLWLRSKRSSGKCTKLRTVATSNNRDYL